MTSALTKGARKGSAQAITPSATTTMKIRRQRTVSRQAIGKQAKPEPAKSSTGKP